MLVDGQRVSRQPSASFNLNDLAVTVEHIERIEVTPAPASLVYGLDAVGGVVNVIQRPAGVPPRIRVSYGRGAEAEQRIAGGAQYGFKKLALRFDGQYLTGDGYRDNGDAEHRERISRWGWRSTPPRGAWKCRWTLASIAAPGFPGPAAYPSPKTQTSRLPRQAARGRALQVRRQLGPENRVLHAQPGVAVQRTDPAGRRPTGHDGGDRPPAGGRSTGVDARLRFDAKSGDIFTAGAESVDDRLDGLADEGHAAQRWSVYTQDQWHPAGPGRRSGCSAATSTPSTNRKHYPLALGGLGQQQLEALGRVGREYWHAKLRRSLPGRAVPPGQSRSWSRRPREAATTTSKWQTKRGACGSARSSGASVKNLIIWADTDSDFICSSPKTFRRRPSAAGRRRYCTARAPPSRFPSATSGSRGTADATASKRPWRRARVCGGRRFSGDRHVALLVKNILNTPSPIESNIRQEEGILELCRRQRGRGLEGQDRFRPGAGRLSRQRISQSRTYETVEGCLVRGRSLFGRSRSDGEPRDNIRVSVRALRGFGGVEEVPFASRSCSR